MELVQQLTSFSRHFPKSIHSLAQRVEHAIFLSPICHKKVHVSFRWTALHVKTGRQRLILRAQILPRILCLSSLYQYCSVTFPCSLPSLPTKTACLCPVFCFAMFIMALLCILPVCVSVPYILLYPALSLASCPICSSNAPPGQEYAVHNMDSCMAYPLHCTLLL